MPRRNGRYAGRIRMEVVPDRSARSLCGFVEAAVEPGAVVVTDAWGGYATLPDRGYRHLPVAAQGDPSVAEDFLPISHLIFSNLKSWLRGCHHGVSPQHLQAYLNEFTFRFNRRFYPFNAFRSLLGISGQAVAPTYDGCTPVHGNIQNAAAKAWRAASELGYRQDCHQIWCSWVPTGEAWMGLYLFRRSGSRQQILFRNATKTGERAGCGFVRRVVADEGTHGTRRDLRLRHLPI